MIMNLQELLDKENTEYAIVSDFRDIDYMLIFRKSSFLPWIAAYGYKEDSWTQGHYFETLEKAMEYISVLQERRKLEGSEYYDIED